MGHAVIAETCAVAGHDRGFRLSTEALAQLPVSREGRGESGGFDPRPPNG
jgi:hypothetical protein